MIKLYVYENEKLGDNGNDFSDDSIVDCIYCDTPDECIAKFEADYGDNNYTASFVRH